MRTTAPGIQPERAPTAVDARQSGLHHIKLIRQAVIVFITIWGAAALAQSAANQAAGIWPDQTQCRTLQAENNVAFEDNPVLGGWCVAIDDRRGNCIACHTFNITPWPESLPVAGNLAPPMVAMRARFPDSTALRSVIEDATTLNKRSAMPPYLKHHILDAAEIDQLLAFLGTL